MEEEDFHGKRLELARESLDGLSVGDALGEAWAYQFYRARDLTDFSVFRDGSVRYTDDTAMALSIVKILEQYRAIEEDLLAVSFATRYAWDPMRGYGKMAHKILQEIGAGADWREVSPAAFGMGSFGNGAAMRVAPLGAYFADEIERIPGEATKSARITHAHPEGIAGAVAVALCAGVATAFRGRPKAEAVEEMWTTVTELTPGSTVREDLCRARELKNASTGEVARELGNGSDISAQDTVPFCVWNACQCLDDYEEAILSTVEVGGDCDTNGAIVGGMVAAFAGREAIPAEWLRVREKLR